MKWYLKVLKNYANFSGRASRKEYWMFFLLNMIFSVVAVVLDNVIGTAIEDLGYGLFYLLYTLAVALPSLAVMVRRLHDVGKSGAMVFVALIPLIGPIWMIALLAKEGEPNINQYGPNPKESGLEVTEQWTSSNAYKDTVLIITVVWLVIDRLWWGVIPEYVEDWFYNDWIFQVGRVISLFQAFVPLGLASLIKNKALRITFFVLGGIYSLHVLYVIIRPFM